MTPQPTPKQQAETVATEVARDYCQHLHGAHTLEQRETVEAIVVSALVKINYTQLLEDKMRLQGLKNLMGYVGNASDVVVSLFQDDATYSYFCKVGKTAYFGSSLNEAIDKAITSAMQKEQE